MQARSLIQRTRIEAGRSGCSLWPASRFTVGAGTVPTPLPPAEIPADHPTIPLLPLPPNVTTAEQLREFDLRLSQYYFGTFRREWTPLDPPGVPTPKDFIAAGAYVVLSWAKASNDRMGLYIRVFSGRRQDVMLG